MVGPGAGNAEVGETVASYTSYEAAQKAVTELIASEVAARDIAIVGKGLRSIERITGRLGYATAARSGAINGILIGLLFSAILMIGNPEAPIQLFFGVLLVGIAIGMLLSLTMFAIVRRRRNYSSVMQVVADHYELTVRAGSIHKAREVLGKTVAKPRVTPDVSKPPQYGERVSSDSAPTDATPTAQASTPAPQRPATVAPPRYGERVSDSGNGDEQHPSS